MGRLNDNGAPKRLAKATPGSPNDSGGAAMPNQPIKLQIDSGQVLTITFQGEVGVQYLLEQSMDLRRWNEAHRATGQTAPIRFMISHGQAQPKSFFRVVIP